MKRSIVTITSFAVLAFSQSVVAAETIAGIFNRAKSEFSQGDYKRSLADIDALDAASQAAGFEKERPKLVPAIAFYRAANLAALGRADEAREEFITFLMYSPNASIASPPFPKTVVDAFQKAQNAAVGRSNTMALEYATFATPAGWNLSADAQWIASPVRYLLTTEQKKAYAALTTGAERQAFVDAFWTSLDPTPDTAVNELRNEFERRVAFADAKFGNEKFSGRETDRGLIFAFLGPPTYVGISDITADSDAIATLRSGGGTGSVATHGNSTRGLGTLTGAGNNDNLETPDKRGKREVWYYRQGRLPAGVPFQEVRFPFITKEGYGLSVLQKESDVLQTLGVATENVRKIKKLN